MALRRQNFTLYLQLFLHLVHRNSKHTPVVLDVDENRKGQQNYSSKFKSQPVEHGSIDLLNGGYHCRARQPTVDLEVHRSEGFVHSKDELDMHERV